ncbi:MAG TPA: hypothetical protein PLZ57_01855 [Pseudobdellovibrionaceae bacterium]|nr:hypothetical protein [Pseudobdellovibrionaceae bacterium]
MNQNFRNFLSCKSVRRARRWLGLGAVLLMSVLAISPGVFAATPNSSWREKIEAVLQRGSTPEIREGLVLGAVLEVQGTESAETKNRGRWSGRWIEALHSLSPNMKSQRPAHQLAALHTPQGQWTVEVRYMGESAQGAERERGDLANLSRDEDREALGAQQVEVTWLKDGEVSHREALNLTWGVTGEAQYRPVGGDLMRAYVKLVKVRY